MFVTEAGMLAHIDVRWEHGENFTDHVCIKATAEIDQF